MCESKYYTSSIMTMTSFHNLYYINDRYTIVNKNSQYSTVPEHLSIIIGYQRIKPTQLAVRYYIQKMRPSNYCAQIVIDKFDIG